MGQYTGAASLFGATGGVMEAALRTVYAVVTKRSMPNLTVTPVRGLDGIKSASMEIGELGEVRVAVAHGLANARRLLDQIEMGESPYHFIEVMACKGGCVGGGGQPLPTSEMKLTLRAQALYRDDTKVQKFRQSHENPAVQELYARFLKHPLSEKSHALLHTHYTERGI
jgi:iron only hydrogenase large subunit-like protein